MDTQLALQCSWESELMQIQQQSLIDELIATLTQHTSDQFTYSYC